MRLLHTTELRFEDFFDDKIPDYAILSDRRGDDEVSYQDFQIGRRTNGSGYAKILAFCNFAATDSSVYRNHRPVRGRFEWVWIDTCCIDQSSSAELSEAINSMYRWYANCVVCYAYLSDVVTGTDRNQTMRAFEDSQWYGRGWTLQELLAPPRLMFFDRHWTCLGTRENLAPSINTAAGISQALVTGFHDVSPISISAAEKFSWIATRNTSRLEDKAYCLMGLFDINMPLLYGEGKKAFRRLQLEVLRSTNDESVFIWDFPAVWPWAQARPPLSGLLAMETTDFGPLLYLRNKDNHDHMQRKVPGVNRPPYTVTNQGLELGVPKQLALKSEVFLALNYRSFKDKAVEGVYAILLQKVESQEYDGWQRSIPRALSKTLPRLRAVGYEDANSVDLFIAPESWLWSREQLAEMETEVIYVRL